MQPKVESDDVEALVVDREGLGVALHPVDLHARLGGPAAGPASSSSGVRSTPTTRAPACAARSAALPVPQATSSTSSPGRTSTPPGDPRSDLPQLALGDGRVVAGGPGGAGALLQLREPGKLHCVHPSVSSLVARRQ